MRGLPNEGVSEAEEFSPEDIRKLAIDDVEIVFERLCGRGLASKQTLLDRPLPA